MEADLSELEHLRRENAALRQQLGLVESEVLPVAAMAELPLDDRSRATLNMASSVQDKISLFRSLFRGREDVYALRWENERNGKKGYVPACADRWSGKGQPRTYLPLTDDVVRDHLAGKETIGIFALAKDSTCWFLACDFDKDGWQLDALAFLEVCRRYAVPAYLERSRSGNGGHVWVFFSAPVSAVQARQLGMRILRQTMDVRGDMDLGSYDRFFPNQDFMPKGGFGNLIAAPLQKKCRALGNSEFVDTSTPELKTWLDQWAFLSGVLRLSPAQLEALLETLPSVTVGSIGSGRPARATAAVRVRHPAPKQIRCELSASFSLEKSGIPPWMLSQVKHLAALHNPKFYENEKNRYSNHATPRFIKCYREDFSHIHLPRGTVEEVQALVREAGSELVCVDRRNEPERIPLEFLGTLSQEQGNAMKAVLAHNIGILVAPPGAGKTVMGCSALAQRGLPTLVLCDRKPLVEQWRKQLMTLLGLKSRQIGQVGGGRQRQTGVVDLATVQSLIRRDDLPEFFSCYGFIIFDECHHLPAATIEACVREASARYFLGLTATPYRSDGLQDIMTMQCGPVRHQMTQGPNALPLRLIPRETSFSFFQQEEPPPIQEIFRAMIEDGGRNALLEQDVFTALARGRRCLILSQWKEHCQLLAQRLVERGKTPFVLNGGMGKKNRTAILNAIEDTPRDKDLIVVATGQYLGEGFDCPQLDALFLAFPSKFRGKLIQYTGRVLREFPGKIDAEVYDYVDVRVPVLNRMYARRDKTYKALGVMTANEIRLPRA